MLSLRVPASVNCLSSGDRSTWSQVVCVCRRSCIGAHQAAFFFCQFPPFFQHRVQGSKCDKSKLLLRPGVVTPNTVVQSLTSSLDWVPTLASLTGYHLPSGLVYDGWDLSELLFTEAGQLADKGARDRRENAEIFLRFLTHRVPRRPKLSFAQATSTIPVRTRRRLWLVCGSGLGSFTL